MNIPTVNYTEINENDWFAVAYEDGYFIGTATRVQQNIVTIDFLVYFFFIIVVNTHA